MIMLCEIGFNDPYQNNEVTEMRFSVRSFNTRDTLENKQRISYFQNKLG